MIVVPVYLGRLAEGHKVDIQIETTYKNPTEVLPAFLSSTVVPRPYCDVLFRSLRFHEAQHHAELEKYMRDHPPPEPNFTEGMSQRQIDQEINRYDAEMDAYIKQAEDATEPLVDEVGTKKSEGH